MTEADSDERRTQLTAGFGAVRARTEALAAPLSPEDQTVQSMPDVSPTKWHRGHVSWFFETFLLGPELPGYDVFHPGFAYLFNSYYEAVGARHPRAQRGLISRPGSEEVTAYRQHVERAMASLLQRPLPPDVLDRVELGLHHEQQHQELLLMDIKHVLSCNPLHPAYAVDADRPDPAAPGRELGKLGWREHEGGPAEIGSRNVGFGFDNESPRHRVQLVPFALAERPVTCGEWLAFMDDGGYERPELWLSDGWAAVQQHQWSAPLYWEQEGGRGREWRVFTLYGQQPVEPAEPVCHVSYYEADAFARWSDARLPTEAEWEVVADPGPGAYPGPGADAGPGASGAPVAAALHPTLRPVVPGGDGSASAGTAGALGTGQVWEWTSSAYSPYPGFRPAAGAVGEYNGKFMVGQQVLRGGACVTPPGHVRPTYRNFFPPGARWPFCGLRLARDL